MNAVGKFVMSVVSVTAAGTCLVVGSAVTVNAAPIVMTSKANKDCLPEGRDDQWPGVINGRPDGFDPGDLGGVYLWHDTNGFHLRVTHHGDDKAVFSGEIGTPRGTLTDVTGVQLEKNDRFTVGPQGHHLNFRFNNYGHDDGLDFRTKCAPTITFAFKRAANTLPAERVFLGDQKAHPASDPFSIARGI